MNIFNNKTVVGLFDHGKDVEKAVAQLQKQGFGRDDDDEIQIIDAHRLAQEMPIDAMVQNIVAQPDKHLAAGDPALVYDPGSQAGVETGTVERNAKEASLLKKSEANQQQISQFAEKDGAKAR